MTRSSSFRPLLRECPSACQRPPPSRPTARRSASQPPPLHAPPWILQCRVPPLWPRSVSDLMDPGPQAHQRRRPLTVPRRCANSGAGGGAGAGAKALGGKAPMAGWPFHRVAPASMAALMSALGTPARRYMATTPAATAAAGEVPEILRSAVSEAGEAASTSTPGAQTSTQGPRLVKSALSPQRVRAPTVRASGTAAGDRSQASPPSLPAETTTGKPAAARFCTALSQGPYLELPSEMETTHCPPQGRPAIQFRPARTSPMVPSPSPPMTCTDTSVAPPALPPLFPNAAPAIAVPCVPKSRVPATSPRPASQCPPPARPPWNSRWDVRTPVSTT
mmetsp:Transcript_94424/g.267221  ORF Transcript_94424/g.267221 Transcript_94424/m.267221 type:complete len:334 (-) Transcript_94424:378-1379(-)